MLEDDFHELFNDSVLFSGEGLGTVEEGLRRAMRKHSARAEAPMAWLTSGEPLGADGNEAPPILVRARIRELGKPSGGSTAIILSRLTRK